MVGFNGKHEAHSVACYGRVMGWITVKDTYIMLTLNQD